MGDTASLDVGDCAAVGDGRVAGTFFGASSTVQVYTDVESNGVWQMAQQLGSFQQFNPPGDPVLSALRCSAITTCEATGTFSNAGPGTSIATMQNGVWHLNACG